MVSLGLRIQRQPEGPWERLLCTLTPQYTHGAAWRWTNQTGMFVKMEGYCSWSLALKKSILVLVKILGLENRAP